MVSLKLEVYVVKDMNTPLILGNDFVDQYSLSIIQDNGNTSLKLGDSGHTVPLDSSVESSYLDVQALQAKAKAILHQKNYRQRKKRAKSNKAIVLNDQTIPLWTMMKVPIKTTQPTTGLTIFVPQDRLPQRIANTTLIDSILQDQSTFIHVSNNTDQPIKLQTLDIVRTIVTDQHYDETPPIENSQVNSFNLVNPILRRKETEEIELEEQNYQDKQPDLAYRPKLAEIPEYEEVPTSELLNSLDFNLKLSNSQRKALERVIYRNQKAFSLDGRIGEYSDIKYSIKLTEDAVPISMLPYHASPEKRQDIDKQIDKWFSQGVIQESDSPWGAPVIVVYQNGKARVCIDYRCMNAVTLADKYPLPQQTDILRALSGSQWLSTFDALSGFHQLEILKEH